MRTLIIALFTVFISLNANNLAHAQDNDKPSTGKWMEEVRNFKHDFIIRETAMTNEQSKVLMPLYTEMEDKIYQANKDARAKEKEVAMNPEASDDDYLNAATALSQVKSIEAEIQNHYFKLFSSILSPKQMFLLKQAENKFAIELLQHNKRSQEDK